MPKKNGIQVLEEVKTYFVEKNKELQSVGISLEEP
jgi:hypothetical protein